jgi:hypothetical protein
MDLTATSFPDDVNFAESTKEFFPVRSIIELMALRSSGSLGEDFDFSKIRYAFWSTTRRRAGQYRLRVQPGIRHSFFDFAYPSIVIGSQGHPENESLLKFSFKLLEENQHNNLPDPPTSWGIRSLPLRTRKPKTSPDTSKSKEPPLDPAALQKLVNHVVWKTFGLVGTLQAYAQLPNIIVQGEDPTSLVESALARSSQHFGPYGGKPLFKTSHPYWGIQVTPFVAATISGKVPSLQPTKPVRRTFLALALESAYRVFLRTSDILVALQELFVATDELGHFNKSILNKETHCKCQDNEEKLTESHFCMLCLRLVGCHTLCRTEDDRLVCKSHMASIKTIDPDDEQRQRTLLFNTAKILETRHGLSLDQRRKNATAVMALLVDGGFKDHFDGVRPFQSSNHPCRQSIDATFPLWMVNGDAFLHHDGNVNLTTRFLNMAMLDDIPIVLLFASLAVNTDDDVRDKIAEVELAFDHCYRIRCVLPYSVVKRKTLAKEQDEEFWDRYYKMMRTGVYDGMQPIYNFKIDSNRSRWCHYQRVE